MREPTWWRWAWLVVPMALGGAVARAQPQLTVIAAAGAEAPGVAGAKFKSVRPDYAVAGSQQVAFCAELTTAEGRTVEAIYRFTGAALELLWTTGAAIEGLPTTIGSGQCASSAASSALYIERGGSVLKPRNDGMLFGVPGAVRALAVTGTPAPAIPGATLKRMTRAQLSRDGQLVWTAELDGPALDALNRHATYVGRPESAELLIRGGAPAPGFAPQQFTGVVQFLDVDGERGALVLAERSGTESLVSARYAVWAGKAPSELTPIIRHHDVDPRAPMLKAWLEPKPWGRWLNGGEVLLATAENGAFVLWQGVAGQPLALVTLAPYPASSVDRFSVNRRGLLAFAGRDTQRWLQALYLGTRHAATKLWTAGDPLPGAPEREVDVVRSLEVSERGHVIVDVEADSGGGALIRITPGVGAELIVGPNSAVSISGTQQAITSISTLCGAPDGLRGCMDEEGRVVFQAEFANRTTALVISSPQTVVESAIEATFPSRPAMTSQPVDGGGGGAFTPAAPVRDDAGNLAPASSMDAGVGGGNDSGSTAQTAAEDGGSDGCRLASGRSDNLACWLIALITLVLSVRSRRAAPRSAPRARSLTHRSRRLAAQALTFCSQGKHSDHSGLHDSASRACASARSLKRSQVKFASRLSATTSSKQSSMTPTGAPQSS